ncbi:MAG: cupredoxin domain-containing protein [bacterium]|nr:cupredoxin domain-containing protein [bacterium]
MKAISISIIIAAVLIGGALIFTGSGSKDEPAVNRDNVSIVDGKQIVAISAKGGYQPRRSTARAGLPTILRFDTKGTFDCSAAVRIPSVNISKFLPQTGSTEIDIGVQEAGTFYGSCGMGMYPFEVEFQD